MNRLQYETSPYLLQHAQNPVDWYPWGQEAFDRARREDKPIFLSVGYSTCHWCHVMARECFGDAEAARRLNERFVPIKVDREERPDVDSVYMEACMRMTGSGGWPLSLFLTADLKPFFAGTYFPKAQFLTLLAEIERLWAGDRKRIDGIGERVKAALGGKRPGGGTPDIVEDTFRTLSESFDEEYGGFGSPPKFPMPCNLRFLLEYHRTTGSERALSMAEKTLTAMAKGGIFDQIGYGFSRYSTDRIWLVPHFEKMLYDNAQLVSVYLECFRLTKEEKYRQIALRCIDYLFRDLGIEGGGFASAQDADSEGREGSFYHLKREEILSVLGEREGGEFCRTFGITEGGNFEGANIPNQLHQRELSLRPFCKRLYDYRKSRHQLHLDDKILTVWNCLTISALAKAASLTKEEKYLTAARDAFDFLMRHSAEGDDVYTSWRAGSHSRTGVLDDYAFLIAACIDLYRATGETPYLDLARRYTGVVRREFADPEGGYFMTRKSSELIVRPKETYDGVIPAANSVMAENLLFLDLTFGGTEADAQFEFLERQGHSGGQSYFAALLLRRRNFRKVVVSTRHPSEVDRSVYARFDLVKVVEPGTEYPLLNGRTAYYLCEGTRCLPPRNSL